MKGQFLLCQCFIILASYQFVAATPTDAQIETARAQAVNDITGLCNTAQPQVNGYALSYYKSSSETSSGGVAVHRVDGGTDCYYFGPVNDNGKVSLGLLFSTAMIKNKIRAPNTGNVKFTYGASNRNFEITFKNIDDARTFMAE